jgi:hypothetical protein
MLISEDGKSRNVLYKSQIQEKKRESNTEVFLVKSEASV